MAYIGNNLTVQQYSPTISYFNGNGSTTAFTLPIAVVSAAQIIVTVENVIQNPATAFTVSGTTLTFTSAPPSGTNNIWVEYTSLQTNFIQPANGSVGTAQLGTITNIASGNSSLTLQTGATPTTAITVDTSQNVGIGTTSASGTNAKLHVHPATNVNIYGTYNGSAYQWTAINDAQSAYVDLITNALTQQFQTGGAERMRIDSSGIITGTAGNLMLVSGTAQASTSGTAINFTGIPSWVKRITVMFNGVSVSGSSLIQIQLGTASGFETTGYVSLVTGNNAAVSSNSTTGLLAMGYGNAGYLTTGLVTITSMGSNLYVNSTVTCTDSSLGNFSSTGGGRKTLSGTLDRVRITTVNGTDTFDAGSINILYE
jgi:hypothetical protein